MNRELFFRHVAQTSDEPIGIEVARAEGIYLYGPDGRRWIDFISGICVNNVGHGAPEVLEAIRRQSEAYLHPMVYGEAVMAPQAQYAARLAESLGGGLSSVFFTNSGAEAVEGALKLAKKYTGRSRLIGAKGSYHGCSHGAQSVSGSEEMKRGYGPFLPEVGFIRFNAFEDLAAIDERTAAVILDVIPAAGGIRLPEPGYLRALRRRCDETGALLIFDEIQTGLGRTGRMYAHEAEGVLPDILLLAKALGGGLPLGAFISRPELMEVLRRNPVLGHISTYGGHPLSCAAGLAAFSKIQRERLAEQVPAKEARLRQRLRHPALRELRGRGLLLGLYLQDPAQTEALRVAALDRGILTLGFLYGEPGLRIAPPLTISEAEIDLACGLLLDAMDAL
jgi:acetylornithine/succinyldiaminopimelate/putrescine aminotransferase